MAMMKGKRKMTQECDPSEGGGRLAWEEGEEEDKREGIIKADGEESQQREWEIGWLIDWLIVFKHLYHGGTTAQVNVASMTNYTQPFTHIHKHNGRKYCIYKQVHKYIIRKNKNVAFIWNVHSLSVPIFSKITLVVYKISYLETDVQTDRHSSNFHWKRTSIILQKMWI